jgi:acyl-CoA thioesterase
VLSSRANNHQDVATLLDRIDAHLGSAGRAQRLQRRPAVKAVRSADDAQSLVLRLVSADPFARSLGIRCTEAGPGTATVTMTVEAQHLNFNGTCHGAVIFALADTAFGLASNSHGKVAAGIDAHITYQQAARAGDQLLARAVEVSRSRKLAVYRVDVTRADGAMLSSFTGTVYVTGIDLTATPQETM